MTQGITQGDLLMIVTVLASLVLAVSSLRSRRLGANRTLAIGVAWAVIIAALAYVLERYTQ